MEECMEMHVSSMTQILVAERILFAFWLVEDACNAGLLYVPVQIRSRGPPCLCIHVKRSLRAVTFHPVRRFLQFVGMRLPGMCAGATHRCMKSSSWLRVRRQLFFQSMICFGSRVWGEVQTDFVFFLIHIVCSPFGSRGAQNLRRRNGALRLSSEQPIPCNHCNCSCTQRTFPKAHWSVQCVGSFHN